MNILFKKTWLNGGINGLAFNNWSSSEIFSYRSIYFNKSFWRETHSSITFNSTIYSLTQQL